MDVLVNGVCVMALVFGLIEFSKQFGVEGKLAQALAFLLGLFLVGVSLAVAQGLLPPGVEPWLKLVVTTLASVLGAMGFYKFSKRFRL